MIKGSKKENSRDVRFTIRFSKQEAEELQRKAEIKKVSIAEYIRYLIKKDK